MTFSLESLCQLFTELTKALELNTLLPPPQFEAVALLIGFQFEYLLMANTPLSWWVHYSPWRCVSLWNRIPTKSVPVVIYIDSFSSCLSVFLFVYFCDTQLIRSFHICVITWI